MVNLTAEHLTAKGNLRKPVVDGFRKQITDRLVDTLGLAPSANGDLFKVIAVAEDGTPFYATVTVTIGQADPNVVREAKPKAKADPVEVPDLGL